MSKLNVKSYIVKLILYFFLILLAFVTVFPFFYMFIAATKNGHQIAFHADQILPRRDWVDNLKNNFFMLIGSAPFLKCVWNSIYISIMGTILTLLSSSLCGYAFAVYEFRGKEFFFWIIMFSLMIPPTVGVIPLFSIMKTLGWFSKARALYLPMLANAYGVFLIRKFLEGSFPKDLLDAARIDGCSEFKLYFKVALPVMLPSLGALAIITFTTLWGAYFLPLLFMREPSSWTIPLMLTKVPPPSAALGGVITMFPYVLFFVIFSKWIIEGIVEGSVREV